MVSIAAFQGVAELYLQLDCVIEIFWGLSSRRAESLSGVYMGEEAPLRPPWSGN